MESSRPTSTEEYVNKVGSELAIAQLLAKRDKDFALWQRVESSKLFFRAPLKDVEDLKTCENLEFDLEEAFELLSKRRKYELGRVNAHEYEIKGLGRIVGTEPATDETFKSLGLERPSSETIKRFFCEGD